MTGPAALHVLLEVPAHIREGLASGELTAWGGTIRDAQGHIRALLTEGRLLREGDVPFDPAMLTQAIGHAQTAAYLASGLGLLNLGVSVTGFAMVRQRLDAIAGQLGRALIELRQVKEDVAWIGDLQMAQVQAGIDAALDMAARAQRQRDRLLFNAAQAKAFEVRRTLHHTMSTMLHTRRAVRRHDVFLEFARASAMLAVAEARCDEAVEGVAQAGQALRAALRDLQQLIDAFDRQRRDFLHDPRIMLELGSEGRSRTAAVGAELTGAVRQVEGVVGQFALREMLGMTAAEWEAQTAPEGSGLVTCVTMPEGVESDRMAWARGSFSQQHAETTRGM